MSKMAGYFSVEFNPVFYQILNISDGSFDYLFYNNTTFTTITCYYYNNFQCLQTKTHKVTVVNQVNYGRVPQGRPETNSGLKNRINFNIGPGDLMPNHLI